MKKTYETPSVEKVNFDYKNQVVASGGSSTCYFRNIGASGCESKIEYILQGT